MQTRCINCKGSESALIRELLAFSLFSVTRCNHMILPLTFYINHFSSAWVRADHTRSVVWMSASRRADDVDGGAAKWQARASQLEAYYFIRTSLLWLIFHSQICFSGKEAGCPPALLGSGSDINAIPLSTLPISHRLIGRDSFSVSYLLTERHSDECSISFSALALTYWSGWLDCLFNHKVHLIRYLAANYFRVGVWKLPLIKFMTLLKWASFLHTINLKNVKHRYRRL